MDDTKQPHKHKLRSEVLADLTVENSVERKIVNQMAIDEPEPTRFGGQPVGKRAPCKRQVFVTKQIAEDNAEKLRELGIQAEVERCPVCGMIHVKELRA